VCIFLDLVGLMGRPDFIVVCVNPSLAVPGSIGAFFQHVRYRIGLGGGIEADFSLDDIEHGLLRNNAVSV
jgi:hypothetical protein